MTRPKAKAKAKPKTKTAAASKKKAATTKNNNDASAEKENEMAISEASPDPIREQFRGGAESMYTIMRHAELKEALHQRYEKELQQLYTKMGHQAFLDIFINVLKTVLEAEEANENGKMALSFCAKFVAGFESEKTHPMLAETFHWLLTIYSSSPYVRYRICYFVNLILEKLGPNAALDDTQCDEILEAMLERVKDVSPGVRKQAVLAMQRLQIPDNPSDPVVCAYQFHLCSDPSPTVRQCIITCMGRNYITVPYILQRLWDVDEKVRRHTYVNMCNYPVRSYKVSQRLTLLEQGLNDSSANVKKTVVNIMLKAWIDSYQQNYLALIAALKLDSSEEELMRFRSVTKQMLRVIFEQTDNQQLMEQLPLGDDCELHRCVPLENLNVELLLYWQCLGEYLESTQADESDQVLPELSVFCSYVEKFCQFQKPNMDKFAQIEFQSMLLSLVEILDSYDLGDEIGRGNMKTLISSLLKDCLLDHKIVRVLVRCMEKLITDLNDRMQFFIEIIYETCDLNTKQNELVHDRSLINKLLDDLDTPSKMKISSLKVKILELEEQEDNFVRQKEYIRAQSVNEEKMAVTEEYTELIKPLLVKHGVLEMPARPKLSKQERVLKGLHISYYMVASPHVHKLTPSICKLYKDFVCRHLPSSEVDIFEWAIKCSTAYSMFYEAYAKEVFEVVLDQFCNSTVVRLCETSARCVLEMLDHYGIDYFNDFNQTTGGVGLASKTKRRQLYNVQDIYDGEDDGSQTQSSEQSTDIIIVMGHYVERVANKGVGMAIVRGLCRLVLRGHLDDRPEVLEQLLKRYFNPNTEPVINQVLGMFFENLVRLKKQALLQPCLLPTLWTVVNCSFDSPLNGVQPDHVVRFFIDLTTQEVSSPATNIHNRIALSFLHYIQNYFTERREICRLLAKELTNLTVNVSNGREIKTEMLEMADKLITSELEPRVVTNINNFKLMVEGSLNPPARGARDEVDSDEECDTETVTTKASENVEQPAQVAAPIPEESANEHTLTNATDSQAEASAVTQIEAAPVADPVLTTYGTENRVGQRFLRRSLYNSTCSSENATTEETGETEASETSRINLRRPQMKRRLQQALARSSKTPEKQPQEQQDSDDSDGSEQNESQQSPARTDKSDTSEVVEASPTSESPKEAAAVNASHLRLRSLRTRSAAVSTSFTAPTASKVRKFPILETPMRNGRKRVIRRTPSDKRRSGQRSSNSLESPSRKQPRVDGKTPRGELVSQNTSSPTDSTSSVKENRVPVITTTAPESQSEAESVSESEPSTSRQTSTRSYLSRTTTTSTPKMTTRHAAQKERINSMCMTRKRMSLEMNLSGGQLSMSTPKRITRSAVLPATDGGGTRSSRRRK
ncbi:condensin complex subunit 3 isoform X1 [Drosophila subobscura]|uniref:condensin complex subunit 3 isoform X1 n=1 Tax=Drosophila subobscura TaxID=7241 RepID=UPI00155A8B23|nr:condensin complex subunit 3 isoform X1 [Drosophila subobscura]